MSDSAVNLWVDRVLDSVTDSTFASVHLDELLPDVFDRAPLKASLGAFEQLTHRTSEDDLPLLALLVISLPPANRLLRNPPRTLEATTLRRSPPALYLCGPNLWSVWGDDEEYRVPVEPSWFPLPQGRVHFRVHRDQRARQRGWEFERSFYIHSGNGWRTAVGRPVGRT